jgi:hypothetical protein
MKLAQAIRVDGLRISKGSPMTRIIVCFAVLLGLSACEYRSQTRVSAAPTPAPVSLEDIKDSMTGVGRQP